MSVPFLSCFRFIFNWDEMDDWTWVLVDGLKMCKEGGLDRLDWIGFFRSCNIFYRYDGLTELRSLIKSISFIESPHRIDELYRLDKPH